VVIPNWKLRKLREARMLSQEEMAEHVGVSIPTYSRWENDQRIHPQPRNLRRLCDFFGVPSSELEYGPEVAVSNSGSAAHPTFQPCSDVTESNPDLAAMEAFRLADRSIGGGHLYTTVLNYLRDSLGPRLLTGRTNLFEPAAALTEMAGWMAHDSGDDKMAQTHFDRAWQLVLVVNAPDLRGGIAAARSHLELHLGRPANALEIARQGRQRLAVGVRHPGLLSRLYAMEGRGLAALGRRRESIRTFNEAEGALAGRDGCGEGSSWVAPFDEASLAGEMSQGLQAIGDFSAARRAAERVIELRQRDRARSRAFAQLSLAKILLTQPRPEPVHACALALEVIEEAATVASARIGHQLRRVGDMLESHRSIREVSEALGHVETGLPRQWAFTRGQQA
jgi:transcriptional regulator with XRE-family HTH domain